MRSNEIIVLIPVDKNMTELPDTANIHAFIVDVTIDDVGELKLNYPFL